MKHARELVADFARRMAPKAPEPHRSEFLRLAEECDREQANEMETNKPPVPRLKLWMLLRDKDRRPAVSGMAEDGASAAVAGRVRHSRAGDDGLRGGGE